MRARRCRLHFEKAPHDGRSDAHHELAYDRVSDYRDQGRKTKKQKNRYDSFNHTWHLYSQAGNVEVDECDDTECPEPYGNGQRHQGTIAAQHDAHFGSFHSNCKIYSIRYLSCIKFENDGLARSEQIYR